METTSTVTSTSAACTVQIVPPILDEQEKKDQVPTSTANALKVEVEIDDPLNTSQDIISSRYLLFRPCLYPNIYVSYFCE